MLYIRGPASASTRRKMSVSQRRRLGIPDGHARVYGTHVPFQHVVPLRYWATWIAWKLGRAEAERFVSEEAAANYPNIDWLRQQWRHKMECSEAREAIRAVREAAYAN